MAENCQQHLGLRDHHRSLMNHADVEGSVLARARGCRAVAVGAAASCRRAVGAAASCRPRRGVGVGGGARWCPRPVGAAASCRRPVARRRAVGGRSARRRAVGGRSSARRRAVGGASAAGRRRGGELSRRGGELSNLWCPEGSSTACHLPTSWSGIRPGLLNHNCWHVTVALFLPDSRVIMPFSILGIDDCHTDLLLPFLLPPFILVLLRITHVPTQDVELRHVLRRGAHAWELVQMWLLRAPTGPSLKWRVRGYEPPTACIMNKCY